MREAILYFLALGLSAPAAAAQDWAVDYAASEVGFNTHAFGGAVSGRFERFESDIRLDPEDLTGAYILAQVDITSGSTGNASLDESMLSQDGLNPGEHALARFQSRDIRRSGDGYEAHGQLAIRGVQRDLILPFTLTIENDRAVADGGFAIARTDFGVGTSAWGDSAAEVIVRLHIEADAVETLADTPQGQ